MGYPRVQREAHLMLSKSIQSIVGIFVGFAIGGVLGLLATPPAPAPSVGEDGLVIAVERVPAVPVELALTIAPGPTTTRPPRDDALLPLAPAAEEASTPAPTAKPTKPTATKTKSTASAPAPTQNPAPKPKPSSRSAPTPPAPTTTPTPDPVAEGTPNPEPEAAAGKKHKAPKPAKPDKPPKPPKPPG